MRHAKGNLFKKLSAILVSAMLVLAMVIPTFAAPNNFAYTPVNGSAITVMKYLILDADATVPNLSFEYQISGGTAASATASTVEIYSGSDTNRVSGTPTIGTAAFTNTSQKYDSDDGETISTSDGIQVPANTADPAIAELETNEEYAKAGISIDFSQVTFNEPGVYRYVVAEQPMVGISSITYDENLTRILDVYIIDNEGELEVNGYVLHKDTTVPSPAGTGVEDEKAYGFINHYNTKNLAIEQAVSGNQASRDEYFEATVTITNERAGNVLNVVLDNCDANPSATGANPTAPATNPSTITVGENGSVEQSFWLQHGQSIMITGISTDASVTIAQDEDKIGPTGEGYSCQTTADDSSFTTSAFNASGSFASVADSTVTVTFTDSKEGTIPTGIFVTAGTGIIILCAAAALIIFFVIRRKRSEQN